MCQKVRWFSHADKSVHHGIIMSYVDSLTVMVRCDDGVSYPFALADLW